MDYFIVLEYVREREKEEVGGERKEEEKTATWELYIGEESKERKGEET